MPKKLLMTVIGATAIVGASLGTASATPSPAKAEVLEARANPWQLSNRGGWISIVGRVRFANTCHVVALDWRHSVLPAQPCSTGNFRERLWIAPNKNHVANVQAFELVATGRSSTAKGEFFVRVAPAPLPPVVITTPPTTSPTTTPPTVTPPPVVVPPPVIVPPPVVTPTTVATTTTTVPPTTTTTAPPVTTTTTEPTTTVPPTTTTVPPTTTVPSTTTTVGATTTTTTAQGTGPSTQQAGSLDWSGYAVTGGPFTSISGTFTVPYLTMNDSCTSLDQTSVWVGIDGYGNETVEQAGIALQPWTCNPDGTVKEFVAQTWYETFPALPVEPLGYVSPGDEVTVTITETSPDVWDFALSDSNPSGEGFNIPNIVWYASATSAEWITECNGGCPTPMPEYKPAVTFSNLQLPQAGLASALYEITQPNSVPSYEPNLAALLENGFTTTYQN